MKENIYEAIKTEDGKKELIKKIDEAIKNQKSKSDLLEWLKKLKELVSIGDSTRLYLFVNCGV